MGRAGGMSVTPQDAQYALIPFVISSIVYMVFILEISYMPVQCAFKIAPIVSLIYFVGLFYSRGAGTRYPEFILLGLFFSGIGDVCLALRPLGLFIPGVAAFGVGHIVYTFGFGFEPLKPFILLPFAIFCLLFNYNVYPLLSGSIALAAPIYSILISVMMWRASVKATETKSIYLAAGCLLFGLSDTILAISNFVTPVFLSNYIIMSTYFLAQCGIALSTISLDGKSQTYLK